ncbi:regulatory protein GemA [Sphingomonas cannabina]|uniref:regulatory protein GemA n=1 Tax=Sphingomonas cannabina TaxID=2899123 RepID=UPI001F345D67|nr:regulatory protein GemA [Sphingomonas cannabina]UIJ46927.1 regulatory protein GemA [Sphingomonas cannabina]
MTRSFAQLARRTVATSDGKSESRKKLMIAVRAACNRLGLDDDARRDIQQGIVGKASMSDMTIAELGKVLDRLNKDWKGPSGHRAHVGKIRALWWSLYWLGAVVEPNDAAIDSFVRRQSGISALRFLDHRNASSVVEALKSWLEREGVDWQHHGTGIGAELADRIAVAHAIWRRLIDQGVVGVGAGLGRYCSALIELPADDRNWSRHEWDAAIKLIGKRLRKELGRS